MMVSYAIEPVTRIFMRDRRDTGGIRWRAGGRHQDKCAATPRRLPGCLAPRRAPGQDIRAAQERGAEPAGPPRQDRKSTRLNSSHEWISYAVFCLKKKNVPAARPAVMTQALLTLVVLPLDKLPRFNIGDTTSPAPGIKTTETHAEHSSELTLLRDQ